MIEQQTIVIFNPALARNLLKEGYKIIDIKPNRSEPERTVFVFLVQDGLMDIVNNYKL